MVTVILTEEWWANAEQEDLEREIISRIVTVEPDKYARCHPEVRWALGRGDDFFKWFRVRIHAVRNGNRYHAPGTGWTTLKKSRVARTPNRVLEIDWSPVKITDSPYRSRRL